MLSREKQAGKHQENLGSGLEKGNTFLILPLTCYEIWSSLHFKLTLLSIKDDIWATFLISVLKLWQTPFVRAWSWSLPILLWLLRCFLWEKPLLHIPLHPSNRLFHHGVWVRWHLCPQLLEELQSPETTVKFFLLFCSRDFCFSNISCPIHSDKYHAMKACKKNKDVYGHFF